MRLNQITLFLTAVAVLLAASPAALRLHAQNPLETPELGAPLNGSASDYVIHADDVLDVYLVDVPEMSRRYRVSPLGTVSVPLVSRPLPAAGMTLAQFGEVLKKELSDSGLVTKPQLTVSVQESRLASVSVTGAVKRPQIYPVFARTTILDVLSQAEGLTDDAAGTAIIRRGDDGVVAFGLSADSVPESARTVTVDLTRLMQTGAPEFNIDVYPGDRVTVPRAGIVYVVGAVNRPGGFPMKNAAGKGMTVLQALALAEDMKSTAMKKKAMLIRNDVTAPGGRVQTPVNLAQILEGKAPDPLVAADDILFIPDSSTKKMLRRGAEAVVQAATGLMIYRR